MSRDEALVFGGIRVQAKSRIVEIVNIRSADRSCEIVNVSDDLTDGDAEMT